MWRNPSGKVSKDVYLKKDVTGLHESSLFLTFTELFSFRLRATIIAYTKKSSGLPPHWLSSLLSTLAAPVAMRGNCGNVDMTFE